ncbi:MAG: SufS family cysteine desulfurase [Deltaproteobacteria bacterium]|nr:SufS family cysteine desulfurase [Deltaproteobacteria bacterium]
MNNNLDFKKYFPIFSTNNVVFLDSAASSQKPATVIEAELGCYKNQYTNIHRGTYKLALAATTAYENTRIAVQKFINASSAQEIIFTKGATESINLVAYTYGENFINSDDEIVVTICEHHSNLIPWQRVAKKRGAKLKVCYLDENQDFSLNEFQSLLTDKTKLVCITHLANGLGLEFPIKEIIKLTQRDTTAKILIDGAQIVAHKKVDMQDLGCDFFVFSAHKVYGPSGVGVLYAKEELLKIMPPFLTGGEMVKEVSVTETIFNDLPYKFEAGTPNIAGVIAFKAALEFVSGVGLDKISAHEEILIKKLEDELQVIPGLKILGAKDKHQSLLCFVLENISPYDLATFLDNQGVAIRVGHHCAQPLINYLGYESSSRISLGCYNTEEDISKVVSAIRLAQKFFN